MAVWTKGGVTYTNDSLVFRNGAELDAYMASKYVVTEAGLRTKGSLSEAELREARRYTRHWGKDQTGVGF